MCILASEKIWAIDLALARLGSDAWVWMPLGDGLPAVDEGEGVEEDGGVSNLPHGRVLWSPGCRGWMSRGLSLIAFSSLAAGLGTAANFLAFLPYLTPAN